MPHVTSWSAPRQLVIGIDRSSAAMSSGQMHDEALLSPREDAEQPPVLLGVRNAEMGKRLRGNGSVGLRIPAVAPRREHFVCHAYIVSHPTDKTPSYAAG